MVGIIAYGGYVPRLRLQRASIGTANAWANRALSATAIGERSMCNWDEDAITMAVDAARDCLEGFSRDAITAVYLASTSLPFADRQNAGIIAGALNLRSDLLTLDVTSSQRAGTSCLISSLAAGRSDESGVTLCVATEHRRTPAGATAELLFGDGSAALMLGSNDVVAKLLGTHSMSVDFVDHYRGQDAPFDYEWEERWIRDEGYMKLVPLAVEELLTKTGVPAVEVDCFLPPCANLRVARALMRQIGLRDESLAGSLHDVCGWTGTAHPIVMLAHQLEVARPARGSWS